MDSSVEPRPGRRWPLAGTVWRRGGARAGGGPGAKKARERSRALLLSALTEKEGDDVAQQNSKKLSNIPTNRRGQEVRLFNVTDVQQGPGAGGSHIVATLLARYHLSKSRTRH